MKLAFCPPSSNAINQSTRTLGGKVNQLTSTSALLVYSNADIAKKVYEVVEGLSAAIIEFHSHHTL